MSVKLLPLNFNKGYEIPVFKESRKGDFWEYGSERPYKNTYPSYLTKLYNESSKHNTIINSKVNFIVGKGFECYGTLSFTEKAQIEAFLRHPNENENSIDLLEKLVKDKKVYGGFCCGIRVNANGKIASVDHIDFGDVRKATDEDLYYYTQDWTVRNPQNNDDFKSLEVFPFTDEVAVDKDYIIYYKEYRPDLKEYPLPDYIACVPYLESDIEIANFTLQNIKNNLTAGYIVSFNNGEPTEEEMRSIERRFKDYATGTDNAGKPLLSFTDQNSDHPSIMPIPTNGQDDRFINLNNQIREEIYSAHAVTSPMLFGIKDSTGLGNNADELRTASELYQNLHIDPEQAVMEQLFNEIVNYNGIPKCLKICKIEPVQDSFSEQTVVSVMTQDEIREKLGLAPLEPQQKAEVGFSAQKDQYLFEQLKDYGYRESELEVIETFRNPISNLGDAQKLEDEYLNNFSFALNRVLTPFEKEILDILIEDSKMPVNEIAEALDSTVEEVNEAIANLQDAGALDKDFNPTKDGKETIQKPDEDIFVVYKYNKRPDISGPKLLDTSRSFCVQMIALSRMYTLDQLKMLRNDFGQTGLDIFTKRGGWYTKPGTDIHTPFCRHIWEQKVVRIKK